jgi:hypothetical protein
MRLHHARHVFYVNASKSNAKFSARHFPVLWQYNMLPVQIRAWKLQAARPPNGDNI